MAKIIGIDLGKTRNRNQESNIQNRRIRGKKNTLG